MWFLRVGLSALVALAVIMAVSARPAHKPAGPTGALRTASLTGSALSRLSAASASASSSALDIPGGKPKCDPPPLPAPTFPNGTQGFGIPFRAALTEGRLRSGYSIQWANRGVDPWGQLIDHITGWVVGLLQVPSLTANVPASGIKFCDDVGQTPIEFTQRNGPVTNTKTTNYACPHCSVLPIVIKLAATAGSPAKLQVTGVEPDGALDLAGTTVADTTLTLSIPNTPTQICVGLAHTSIPLSNKPQPEPAGGPPNAPLTFSATPLTGPFPSAAGPGMAPASARLVANNFLVPAFAIGPTTGPTQSPCYAGTVFNQPLGGFDASGQPNYPATDTATYASAPGWSQFVITTTLTDIALPVGAPQGFGF